jgi:hypothetical protein
MRRRVGGVDLDPDRVVGAVPGDGAAGIVVLGLQADLGGADVLAIDAGASQGIDDSLPDGRWSDSSPSRSGAVNSIPTSAVRVSGTP